MEQMIQIKLV